MGGEKTNLGFILQSYLFALLNANWEGEAYLITILNRVNSNVCSFAVLPYGAESVLRGKKTPISQEGSQVSQLQLRKLGQENLQAATVSTCEGK